MPSDGTTPYPSRMPHEPFTLGSFEIVPLCDGWAPLPLDDEAPGHDVDWDAQRSLFPWAFPPDDTASWAWHVHGYLIRHPEGVVLVDTGIGDFGRPPFDVVGRLDAELSASGVAPQEVRHVILTHLHADHAGATSLPDGGPRFPNARYHVHPDDWTFFAEHRTPDDFTGRFAMAALDELGLLDLDPSDHSVLPGLSLRHAPGHTPGHRVVRVNDGGDTMLLVGDLLHTPPQVSHPTWRSNHDEDPELAAQHRAIWIETARREQWTVCVSHFGHPFGHVRDEGWASH
jgi:glyoxylase-like metal-dependent hydrolase (beta-lactamase superfamily II)